jgi:hypothetical protein
VSKLVLYSRNLGIAAARIPKSILGLYVYSTDNGYVMNVLATVDCLGNTLAGGDPDETISSRSGKAAEYEQSVTPASWGFGCRMCSFLAIFQQDHCKKAIARWKGRRAVIPDETVGG